MVASYSAHQLASISFIRRVWPVQPEFVLDPNARGPRTGSGQNGPPHGSQPLSSPALVSQSAGIGRVVAGRPGCGEEMYARALDLSIQTGQNQF